MNRYQLAALVGNKKQRDRAIYNYYQNPKVCLFCEKTIIVRDGQKVSEVKKKNFCDRHCSVSYNNSKREKKPTITEIKFKKQKFDYLLEMTKKELYDKHGIYYKFRAILRRHAQYVFEKSTDKKVCFVCGYDKFVEVCHIKPVSGFPMDSKVKEINSSENLVGLCPNHHKEFDKGLINLRRAVRSVSGGVS